MDKRILVIDDEKDVRLILSTILSRQGYVVWEAEDGERGLKRLLKGRFDLVILDLKMPRMDGYTFMERMKENKITVPVIVLTAREKLLSISRVYGRGETIYLTKPFNKSEVLDIVNYFVGEVNPEKRKKIEKLVL